MPLQWKRTAGINIDAAGTAQRVTTTPTLVFDICFAAPKANTGNIYVGDADCSATDFIVELEPGESWNCSGNIGGRTPGEFDLSDFYVDAGTTDDDVMVSYLQKE